MPDSELAAAITEGTANFLVNRRMNRSQQNGDGHEMAPISCFRFVALLGTMARSVPDHGQKVPTRERLISTDDARRMTPNLEPVPSISFNTHDRGVHFALPIRNENVFWTSSYDGGTVSHFRASERWKNPQPVGRPPASAFPRTISSMTVSE